MKNGDLEQAMNHIDDKYLEEAVTYKKSRKPIYFSALAAVLVLALLLSVVRGPMQVTAHAIAQAKYPDSHTVATLPAQDSALLDDYFLKSIPVALQNDGMENRLFFPVHEYMFLAVLAEITDGASRNEILNLLGADSLESLEATAHTLWLNNHREDDEVQSLLATSLWMDESLTYKQETLDRLAQQLYTSSYQGKMGSKSMDNLLSQWLSEQTGDTLDSFNSDLPSSATLVIATAANFDASWVTGFPEEDIASGTFHGTMSDSQVDFLHRTDESQTLYRGDHFTAIDLPLTGGCSIAFLLPDQGNTANDLLSDEQAMSFLLEKDGWTEQEQQKLSLSIPKFDIASEVDMREILEALDVTSVFHSEAADFSPISDDPTFLSTILQSTQVSIDEFGEGDAATATEPTASPSPLTEGSFTLDRPFLFAIMGLDGNPLLVSVVNQL